MTAALREGLPSPRRHGGRERLSRTPSPGPAEPGCRPPTAGPVESDVLVITAGLGTNEVLELLPGLPVRFPLRPDRPSQSKYFIPAARDREQFTETAMPVFAYLDIGIYGHPIYDGKTPGVKIGFYNPPDVARATSRIGSVEDFVAECMPGLRGAEVVDVAAASGVDTCWYDLVADDEFILGAVPGAEDVYTGVGWRGTGYKFAPWVGRVLAQLAVQQRHGLRHRPFHARPVRRACQGPRWPVMTLVSPIACGAAPCSAPRVMCSSWNAAVTSRPGRSCPRWCWTSPTPCASCTGSSCARAPT